MKTLQEQYFERKQKRQDNSDFYRIKTQYNHTIVFDVTTFKNKRIKTKSYSEVLNFFNGKVLSRKKESKKQYESLFEDYKHCAKLAIQNTIIDYIIKYCEEHNIDFWNAHWIETQFLFYKAKVKYFCRIDYVELIDEDNAHHKIDMLDGDE